MQADMRGNFMIRPQTCRQHEADFALYQHVRSAVPRSGLRTPVRSQPKAERGAVEMRGLARVAHVELQIIGAVER